MVRSQFWSKRAQKLMSFSVSCRCSLNLFLVYLLSFAIQRCHCIWPLPQSTTSGNHTVLLSKSFKFETSFSPVPDDLASAISRTQSFIQNDKLARLVVGRGASDVQTFKSAKTLASLKLELEKGSVVESIMDETIANLTSRHEEYTLTVPEDGSSATLKANSTLGLLRGLTTFGQLWFETSGQVYMLGAPTTIVDAPAFVCQIFFSDFGRDSLVVCQAYRGFMLDTARNL